jgi:hypothetical protein
MSDQPHTASFRYTDVVWPNGVETKAIIGRDVWPSLSWTDRENPQVMNESVRHVQEDVTEPQDFSLLGLLTCPARANAAESQQEIVTALNERKVLQVPWCLESDGTVVLGPPYTTGNVH